MDELKQYFFDRNVFCSVVLNVFTVEQMDDIFELCEGCITIGSFHCFQSGGEYYIFDMETGVAINWYKHLGRTNTCNDSKFTVIDLYLFFMKLHNAIY